MKNPEDMNDYSRALWVVMDSVPIFGYLIGAIFIGVGAFYAFFKEDSTLDLLNKINLYGGLISILVGVWLICKQRNHNIEYR